MITVKPLVANSEAFIKVFAALLLVWLYESAALAQMTSIYEYPNRTEVNEYIILDSSETYLNYPDHQKHVRLSRIRKGSYTRQTHYTEAGRPYLKAHIKLGLMVIATPFYTHNYKSYVELDTHTVYQPLGRVKVWYPTGQRKFRGKVFRYNTVGKAKTWYPSGQIHEVLRYSKYGFLNGKYRKYYADGTIHVAGCYQARARSTDSVGIWQIFFPSGMLQKTIQFTSGGRRYGLYQQFHENGRLALTGQYRAFVSKTGIVVYDPDTHDAIGTEIGEPWSMKHGLWLHYSPAGALLKEEIWGPWGLESD